MPNPVPAAAEGLPEINRRTLLSSAAAVPVAALAGASAALAATHEGPTAQVPETNWSKAVRLAHELSAVLDNLSADGALMVEVHAAKSGHARVGFRDAIPNDARGMLDHYAACYRQTAQAIEPDVTEWSHVTWADDDVDTRFFLAGCRKAVQS